MIVNDGAWALKPCLLLYALLSVGEDAASGGLRDDMIMDMSISVSESSLALPWKSLFGGGHARSRNCAWRKKSAVRQRRDILQGSCQAASVPFAAGEPSGDWWYGELVFRHLSARPCRDSGDIGTRGG